MTAMVYTLVMLFAGVVAAAFAVLPLLRRRRAEAVSERQAELSAHRGRSVDLEADYEAGNLSESEYREAREELERQVLEGVSGAAAAGAGGGGRAMALVAGVMVPAFALGIYLLAGQPEAVLDPSVSGARVASSEVSPERSRAFIEDNLPELERRVAENPEDVQASRMLARGYMVLGRPADAARTLADIIERAGERPALLVDRARALALAGNGRFRGEARELLERTVSLAPGHPDALWFAGIAAAQASDFTRARELWQRLLAELPPGSDAANRLSAAIEQLGGAAAPAAAASTSAEVALRVRLDPVLAADLPADTTVFVYARAPQGPAMPLAVQRLTLGELPAAVTLDQSMAMAGRSLADVEAVELVARVSPSGKATPSPGDLEGRAGPVRVADEGAVELVIDRKR